MRYSVANPYYVSEALKNSGGSNEKASMAVPEIQSLFSVELDYLFTPYSTSQRYQLSALENHYRNFMWPWQFSQIDVPAGERLFLTVPNTTRVADGVRHDGTKWRDFSKGVDITDNNVEYYFSEKSWIASSEYPDNVRRAPRTYVFETRNSSGQTTRRFVMHHDGEEGLTARENYSPVAGFLSANNKMYGAVGYNASVQKGTEDEIFSAWGFIDPDFDQSAAINFTYQKMDGRYGFVWYSNKRLIDYPVPLPNILNDRSYKIVSINTGVTISDGRVSNSSLNVSTLSSGGFELVFD